jgi:hypothetical protein
VVQGHRTLFFCSIFLRSELFCRRNQFPSLVKEFYVQCRDVTDGFGADTIDARGTFVKAEVKFLARIGRYLDSRHEVC